MWIRDIKTAYNDIEGVLLSGRAIADSVAEMANEIAGCNAGAGREMMRVPIMAGSIK